MSTAPRAGDDRWSAWLAAGRFAGQDQPARQAAEDLLAAIRDRVIGGARLRPGAHAVDIGAGTGLLASAAARAVAPGGAVTAVDISRPALARIDAAASPVPLRRVTADATRLPLPAASADAALTRSALVYISDLPAAVSEIARILRPGGLLSAFEPVNARRRHDADLQGMTRAELDAIDELRRNATPESQPMLSFTEDTAAALARRAGLTVETLDVEAVTDQLATADAVDAHLRRSPHPGSPSPIDQVTAAFGEDTARRYRDAWHLSVTRNGPVTFTTPVMFLVCTRN